MPRVGVWLIGGQGSLASTVVLGARAIARGLAPTTGLVTALPELARLPLAGLEAMVFGGWDVRPTGLVARARALAREDGAVPERIVEKLREDLAEVEARVRPGYAADRRRRDQAAARGFLPRGERLGRAIERLGDDLDGFRAAWKLDTVVVVNVASTEPPLDPGVEQARLDGLRRLVQQDRRDRLPPSLVYAYAALERGYPYLNFTPSPALAPPALGELGQKHHVPFYGSDGKTGETLLKTVLAPLFRWRNLRVLSWEGFNILGGGDGRVLAGPRPKRSKLRSKGGVLAAALGYAPHAGVSIEYVPSLGNWKTAWDFIHFQGFLGTKMSAQFVWQGCDSVLAAPLVLDLVRLAELAQRRGEAGPMTHLACFFKDPLGVPVQVFGDQVRLLLGWVERHARRRPRRA